MGIPFALIPVKLLFGKQPPPFHHQAFTFLSIPCLIRFPSPAYLHSCSIFLTNLSSPHKGEFQSTCPTHLCTYLKDHRETLRVEGPFVIKMLRSTARCLFRGYTQLGMSRYQVPSSRVWASTMLLPEERNKVKPNDMGKGNETEGNIFAGKNISRREKIDILIKTLMDLDDSKDSVYGTLDAWVAWEQHFPIAPLKNVLLALEKDQQWHRVVQVIKWMLSKGQGNTMGTYQQLIRALDMDHRAEEAHNFWLKKIGNDLHSVPWQTCHLMISIYYRNKMFEHLVKLFKGLEAFDRKPPQKSILQKVADAYELLGKVDDKEILLKKYADLFNKTRKESDKKSKAVKSKMKVTSSGSRNSPVNA